MRSLKRPEAPEIFRSSNYQIEQHRLKTFVDESKKQTRFDFDHYVVNGIKEALMAVFHGKCSYCETPITDVKQGDFETFRPKSFYSWLIYEWENQLISCPTCNQRYKRDLFPVKFQQPYELMLHKTTHELNALEYPLLVNPFDDLVEEHFSYDVSEDQKKVFLVGISERGEESIKTLGLNRTELTTGRYVIYARFGSLAFSLIQPDYPPNAIQQQQLTELLAPGYPFAGMLEYFRKKSGIEKAEDGTYYYEVKLKEAAASAGSDNLPESTKEQKRENIIIDKFIACSIEIVNFKSIGKFYFKFRDLEENRDHALQKFPNEPLEKTMRESWLLLLGENGVGKSSILQAVALALIPQSNIPDYIDPKTILREGSASGYIKIGVADQKFVELHFNKDGIVSGNIGAYNDYLIAYGATRLLPKGLMQPDNSPGKIHVRNLFDYSIALNNSIEWLLGLNVPDFDSACLFLKDLLFLKENLTRDERTVYTNESGIALELSWVSDGHKTLLALAVDILKIYSTEREDARYTDVQKHASGIILIDEIGTHLHPAWKMKIVERLRTALPKVFFIVTTHEPLCMRGLREKEVIVLRRDPGTGEAVTMENLPLFEGLRVDQLLTSRYFGLNTTIDPELETKFEDYYRLLGVPEEERTPDNKAKILALQEELKAANQLGENARDELFYYIIDETIASNIRNNGMKTRNELKQEVKSRVEALLNEIDLNILG